jgi:hypothetical protein
MIDPDPDGEDLKRLARELGRGAAGTLDPERISGRVLTRLRSESRVRVVSLVLRWGVGLAAAAALAIAVVSRPGSEDPAPAVAALVSIPELDDLTAAELEAVLETIPLPVDSSVHVEAAPMDELNAQELLRVLRTLE